MTSTVTATRGVTGVSLRTIRRLLDFFLSKAETPNWLAGVVSLVLTDDATIQAINRTHLRHDYPTDVISFVYAPVPRELAQAEGELFVNLELACRIGPRFGGAQRELALYIAHGCDHLFGERDDSPVLRRRMRRRELRWVREANHLGLLNNLILT